MPATFPLSTEQLDRFDRRGVMRLPAFYPRADIDEMANRLWAYMATRHGMERGRPESWTIAHPAQFRDLRRSGAFAALASPQLFTLADALLGAGCWEMPSTWGAPLVTFPTPEPEPPYPAWHLDIGGLERLDPLPTLRTFTFLEPVLPHGGGTLIVEGSHHLAMEMERAGGETVRSKQVCEALRAGHPWFARLLETPTAGLRGLIGIEQEIGHHRVRLEEMTGAPGDLIVMHPALLHGTAHNALDRPRLMLTDWIRRRAGPAE